MAKPTKLPKGYVNILYCLDSLAASHQDGTLTNEVLKMYAEGIKGHARELLDGRASALGAAQRLVTALQGVKQ